VHGARACLLCGKGGWVSRVDVPAAALRVVDPDYSSIRAYWLCVAHGDLPSEDEAIVEALRGKAKQGEAQCDERGTEP
jgi:hypothetical protein